MQPKRTLHEKAVKTWKENGYYITPWLPCGTSTVTGTGRNSDNNSGTVTGTTTRAITKDRGKPRLSYCGLYSISDL